MPLALFGIDERRAEPGRQPPRPAPGRRLARADRLDLPRRPPPDRGPGPGRLRRAGSLFPFIGTVVYTILRPPEFLEDARERELEIQAAELRVRQLTELSCPHCEHPIERTYLRCPDCQRRLKDPCRVLRQARRPPLVALPLLRDAAAPRAAAPPPAGAARRRAAGRARAPPERERTSAEPAREGARRRRARAAARRPQPSALASAASAPARPASRRLRPTERARSAGRRRRHGSEQPAPQRRRGRRRAPGPPAASPSSAGR